MASFIPLPKRYFLFNFFVRPDNADEFKIRWQKPADYVMKEDGFISTHLHCSTDDSISYPWINFALTRTSDICVFGKPDEEWLNLTVNYKGPGLTKGYPAGYREIASYKGNKLVEDDKSSSKTSRFFITAIKVRDDITDEQFDSNWTEWSGADFLHEKLKNEKLKDSLLYKRFTTNMSPAFRYVVRTEVDDVSDDLGHAVAKETNNQTHPDGIETATGFYEVAITCTGKAA